MTPIAFAIRSAAAPAKSDGAVGAAGELGSHEEQQLVDQPGT